MHRITLIPVLTDDAAKRMSDLCAEVWREYWTPILGPELVEHAIRTRQSFDAVREDVLAGRPHWFVLDEGGETVGYTASRAEPSRGVLYVSKVYLLKGHRGKGYASEILEFHEKTCAANGLAGMELHVNVLNERALKVYLAKGWTIEREVVSDLGSGYETKDYIMVKRLDGANAPR